MKVAKRILRALFAMLYTHWRAALFVTLNVGATTVFIGVKSHFSQGTHDSRGGQEPAAKWRTFSSADFGLPAPVTLEDGSVLRLSPSTQVKIEFASDRRLVELVCGEAAFKVAHNSRRPFDVWAAGTTVQAVGTEFSVRVRPEHRVVVRVTEGSVKVNSSAQTEIRYPFHLNTAQLGVGDIAVSDSLGIAVAAQGWVTFNPETLTQMVEQINRFGWARLEIVDPRIAQTTVAGSVRIPEPDSFAPTLRMYGIVRKPRGQGADGTPKFLLRAAHHAEEPLD